MSRVDRRPVAAVNDNVSTDGADAEDCAETIAMTREIGALRFSAQFLVWSVRNWVQAFKARSDFDVVTGGTFERFGLAAAASALDRMMTVLAAAATRPIDIRCLRCRYLSPDEALLMEAVAAAQAENFFLATVALRKLMPGSAARLALPHAADLARDLHAAGMMLDDVAHEAAAERPPARALMH